MKDVLIVGGGGFGREVFGYAEDCIADGTPWRIKGFLDENANALDGYDYPCGIVGKPSEYAPKPNEVLLLALGMPKTKKIVAQALLARGAVFETLRHPTARLGRNVRHGQGCIFCHQVNLPCDAVLGDFVTINVCSGCGHDARVGSWSTLSAHCDVTGFAQLGEGVFLASGACVMPSGKVGDWSIVGINSAVVLKVKPGHTVLGTPAMTIRKPQ